MDKQQYFAVTALMHDTAIDDTDRLSQINQILGVNVTDPNEAKTLKEKVIGNDTIFVAHSDGDVTVAFSGFEVTTPSFGMSFMTALLNAIGTRAIDKFLPEPKVEKTKEGGKRDGNGSPAPVRALPIKGRNY